MLIVYYSSINFIPIHGHTRARGRTGRAVVPLFASSELCQDCETPSDESLIFVSYLKSSLVLSLLKLQPRLLLC